MFWDWTCLETKHLQTNESILILLIWLVVSTPLKNISQNGNLPRIGVNIKHIWNHHPVKEWPFTIYPSTTAGGKFAQNFAWLKWTLLWIMPSGSSTSWMCCSSSSISFWQPWFLLWPLQPPRCVGIIHHNSDMEFEIVEVLISICTIKISLEFRKSLAPISYWKHETRAFWRNSIRAMSGSRGANRLIPSQGEPVNWMLECSKKSHKNCEISLGHQYVYICMYISAFYPKSPLKKQHTLRWLSNSKKKTDVMWQQTFLDRNFKKQTKHHPTIPPKPTSFRKFHSSKNSPNQIFVPLRVENDLLVPADVRACL